MTKEITKAFILQQIQDKFKLRELIEERFTFSENVVPVYDITPHLGEWGVLSKTLSITSATSFLFFTVPPNEQWLLRAYMIVYGMTGAIKGSGVLINKRPPMGGYIYLDLKKGQEVSYLVNLPICVKLHPGTEIKYLIDSYTTTQDLLIQIDVLKEEIR